MAKLKTPEQKERDRNNRLLRTYGITSDEYDSMLVEQGRVCKICGSDGGARKLHVDHDHKWKQVRIGYTAEGGLYRAFGYYRGRIFEGFGEKKKEATLHLKLILQRASIRGLLCWPDNRLLRSAFDQPERLASAAQYLIDFQTFTASAPTTKEK